MSDEPEHKHSVFTPDDFWKALQEARDLDKHRLPCPECHAKQEAFIRYAMEHPWDAGELSLRLATATTFALRILHTMQQTQATEIEVLKAKIELMSKHPGADIHEFRADLDDDGFISDASMEYVKTLPDEIREDFMRQMTNEGRIRPKHGGKAH